MARLYYIKTERNLHKSTYSYNSRCKKYISENKIGSN